MPKIILGISLDIAIFLLLFSSLLWKPPSVSSHPYPHLWFSSEGRKLKNLLQFVKFWWIWLAICTETLINERNIDFNCPFFRFSFFLFLSSVQQFEISVSITKVTPKEWVINFTLWLVLYLYWVRSKIQKLVLFPLSSSACFEISEKKGIFFFFICNLIIFINLVRSYYPLNSTTFTLNYWFFSAKVDLVKKKLHKAHRDEESTNSHYNKSSFHAFYAILPIILNPCTIFKLPFLFPPKFLFFDCLWFEITKKRWKYHLDPIF